MPKYVKPAVAYSGKYQWARKYAFHKELEHFHFGKLC